MNVVYDVGSWRLTDDGRIYRQGKLRFANGDIYDGEWLDGKRQGRGTFTYVNGTQYHGEFDTNLFHGFGAIRVPDMEHPLTKEWIKGSSFEGHFLKGRKHGKGTLVNGDGSSYDGNFLDNVYSGHGVYCYANGDRYEGEWRYGKYWGQGLLTYRDGGSYAGEFQNGHFHGFGTRTFPRHLGSYTGTYRYGIHHGSGVRVFADSSQYEGEWKNNKMHGTGVWTTEKFIYIGDFANGQPHGNGVFRYENGDIYEGQVHSGYMYGKGKYTYKDGSYYDGEYIAVRIHHKTILPAPNNKRHGKGIRVWTSGSKYEGEWSNDVMHGKGALTSQVEGLLVEYIGTFRNGQQTGDGELTFIKTTSGKTEFPFGSGNFHYGKGTCKYIGSFFMGEFHGLGHFIMTDGRYFKGEWSHGKRHGQGEAQYIPLAERGNEKRNFISGKDALYRMDKYIGQFENDIRHGHGILYYSNGESIEGNFVNGHIDGVAIYTYTTKKTRQGRWYRGTRMAWEDEE
ncbi:radial spoke protein 1 [Thraustotheca clavata]|uniref:Radial spoke protein 1 n=1 Tax=Thraustotheca clavata TaxID=74557 RepID=A0A1W0A3D1_9STRA|nr:radial spoke protein 1 [Thraustotheca clavata]